MRIKACLIAVCVLSHLVKAFCCPKVIVLAVDKILLDKIIHIWGISDKLHSDCETHWTLFPVDTYKKLVYCREVLLFLQSSIV